MKNLNKGFIVPLLIVIIALLLAGGGAYVYMQQKQANSSDTSNASIYKNIQYGFEIATSSSGTVLPAEATNPFIDAKEISFQINDSVSVAIIYGVDSKSFANALSESAGQYLIARQKLTINNKEAEYLEMGYASGMRGHDYIFNKGSDSIVVHIFIPETESPQALINSFKFTR